jgi:hypothetical protein
MSCPIICCVCGICCCSYTMLLHGRLHVLRILRRGVSCLPPRLVRVGLLPWLCNGGGPPRRKSRTPCTRFLPGYELDAEAAAQTGKCMILPSLLLPSLWTNSVRNAFRNQAGGVKLQETRAAASKHWRERVWYRHNERWSHRTWSTNFLFREEKGK